jgi:hypothetical protein
MRRTSIFSKVSLACAILFVCTSLFSQENRGSIQGLVSDQQGAAVPGATITATNTATGVVTTTKTDSSGNYGIPFLPPGSYRVSVEAASFATSVNSNVVLAAAQTQRLDFALQISQMKQQIEVTSEAPMLETATNAVQGSVGSQTMLELPLQGQNASAVIMLLPGVTNMNNFFGTIIGNLETGGVSPSANGLRDSSGGYTADGANINVGFYNYPAFNPVEDAVQEVSVQTGNYSAEYGIYGGIHANYVLKSGANAFHGDAWEYVENNDLDARNFFSPTVAPIKQNEFGGVFGGPIRKNKTFFFLTYQGIRSNSAAYEQNVVLTAAERQGDLSVDSLGNPIPVFNDPTTGQPFPLVNGKPNQIPTSRFATGAAEALNVLEPAPNAPAPFNFQQNIGLPKSFNTGMAKIDNVFSDRDNLSGRFYIRRGNYFQVGDSAGAGIFTKTNIPTNAYNVALIETHTFSPTAVLASRASYNRQPLDELYFQNPSSLDTRALFGITIPSSITPTDPMNIYPIFSVSGFTPMGESGNDPTYQFDENYEIASTLALSLGKHSLKIGTEIDRFRSGRFVNINTNGNFNYANTNPNGSGNALADFLLGLPSSSTVSTKPITDDIRHTIASFFIADNWRVTRKLTLDWGIRYEMDLPMEEHWGRMSTFSFTPPGQFNVLSPGESLYNTSYRNWAPRLGFTYQLTSKDVIRSAAGIYYSFPDMLFMVLKANNPPEITSYNFSSAPGYALTNANAFPLGEPGASGLPSPNTWANYQKTPRVFEWNFDIQHSFSPNLMLDVGYLGNRAASLVNAQSLNTPTSEGVLCPISGAVPGCTPYGELQPFRPLPNFGPISYWSASGFSTYESLQVKLEKRFSKGLSVLAAYTWSKSMDIGSDEAIGYTYFPNALNQFYGPSDMDVPHNLSVAYVYRLPVGKGRAWNLDNRVADEILGGWELSGVTSYQSGFPFNVSYSENLNNEGLGEIPDRICNGKLSNRSIQEWFNPACFVSPIPASLQSTYSYGFQGNAARGILRGPHLTNCNIGMMKDFTTYEKQYLQFRCEFYNAFNNVAFGAPASTVGPGITDAGVISSAGPARVISFGMKYYF